MITEDKDEPNKIDLESIDEFNIERKTSVGSVIVLVIVAILSIASIFLNLLV